MKTKYQIVLIVLILLPVSCVSSKINEIIVTAPFPVSTTYIADIQATSTPELTPFPTFAPTSTLPPPLPTLQLTQPPAGLLFTSFHTAYDHVLHQILASGNISQITNDDEQKPLLSDNQGLVAFVRYVPLDAQNSMSIPQLWIRDREKQIEKQISPPENCDILTDMFTWSPDNLRLYYFVSCEYDRDLWYININTWKTENLTANAKRVESCDFNYFYPRCIFNKNSLDSIYIESEPVSTPLAIGQIYIPRWSSSSRLTEINVNSGEYIILDEDNEIFGPPSISPDGNIIAYDRGVLLHKDGALEKLQSPDFGFNVFTEEDVDLVNPSWSPDGRIIAWDAAHINGISRTALVFYDVMEKSFQPLLTFEPYYWNVTICTCQMWYARPHAWSPSSEYFAYSIVEFVDQPTSDNSYMFLEEHSSLHIYSKDGKEVFSMQGVEGKLAWSPDGKWLAFQASERNSLSMPIFIVQVDEWKAYKVHLPFEDVRLEGWGNSTSPLSH